MGENKVVETNYDKLIVFENVVSDVVGQEKYNAQYCQGNCSEGEDTEENCRECVRTWLRKEVSE